MYTILEKDRMELVSCSARPSMPLLSRQSAYLAANLAAAPVCMQNALITAATSIAPSLADFTCYAFMYIYRLFAGLSGVQIPMRSLYGTLNSYYEILCDIIAYPIFVLLPFAVFAAVRRIPVREAAGAGHAKAQVYFAAVACALGISTVSGFISAWMDKLLSVFGVYEPYYGGVVPFDGISFILQLISICIMPAFIEEYCFRGVTFAEVSYIGGTEAAVVITALIFALMHQSIVVFPTALIFGLFAGWLRGRYDAIGPCIAAHFTVNFVSLMFDMAGEYLDTSVYYTIVAVFDVLSIAALILGVCYFVFSSGKSGLSANFRRGNVSVSRGIAYNLLSVTFIASVIISVAAAGSALSPL